MSQKNTKTKKKYKNLKYQIYADRCNQNIQKFPKNIKIKNTKNMQIDANSVLCYENVIGKYENTNNLNFCDYEYDIDKNEEYYWSDLESIYESNDEYESDISNDYLSVEKEFMLSENTGGTINSLINTDIKVN